MGGFHGGHSHHSGGFHGGGHFSGGHSHSSFRGGGGHYHGSSSGGGGGDFNPFSLISVFVVMVIAIVGFCVTGGEVISPIYFIMSVIGVFVILAIWVASIEEHYRKINEALKSNKNVDNSPNKVYEVVEVQSPSNKNGTLALKIIGSVFVGLATLFVFIFMTGQTTATVTSVSGHHDYYGGGYYETYEFEYTVNGKTYTGVGDDDCEYVRATYDDSFNYVPGYYVYDIEVGDQYPIYYYYSNPSQYFFSDNPQIGWIITDYVVGVILLGLGIIFRRKYLKTIEFVGDLNNDGKINEEDLKIYKEKKLKEAQEEQAQEKAKSEKPFVLVKCPYCGSKIVSDVKNCPFCGGTMNT